MKHSMLSLLVALIVLLVSPILAVPTSHPVAVPPIESENLFVRDGGDHAGLESRSSSVSALSSAAISAYTPYAQFVRAAYCNVSGWNCGGACKANSDFILYASGGDGNAVPKWYTGYWPTEKTVVVAHEGTDPTQFKALLTDLNVILKSLNKSLFPGLSSSIKVHDGFADAHASTASTILASVKKIISEKSPAKITVVGHSLGGALALLDAAYLRVQLGSSIPIKIVTLGVPRVGNQQFADYIDANFSGSLTRITNRQDLIPIVPGRFLGYRHPSGEVHIKSSTSWMTCTGQDNTDGSCSTGAVPNIFLGNIVDHLGAYGNIFVGTVFCN